MQNNLIKTLAFLIALTLCSFNTYAQEEGPERWESTIQKFEEQDAKSKVEPGAILFVGSSSIAKWQDVGEYFPSKRVLNRGFGGSDFIDLLYYSDRVIYPYQPSKIFIYEGDNDLAKGEKPMTVLKRAKKLRKKIRKNLGETPVVFISPKPSVARWELKEQYEELNALLKDYAAEQENTEFADVWNPALDENGKVFTDIFVEDNLHMNEKGYQIWHEVLAPYVNK
ncbi:GDSL-type esterase/lipase family protein [Catalinimonas sp. 4WD22]|uniref:GDSL-type esterase/lipase family protein n=1 Tax=Catalinimonas locisalis TaxID=3133978 RepID=UPI0031017E0D